MNKRSGSLDFVNNLTGFEMIKDHNHQTETQEFSCNYSVIKKCNHTHKHTDAVSLIDIISSDKRSDFNCSGGFCMDKSHFHKKGISPKKQLFNYFINISC
ncbi:hypothetical protein [Aquimarina sp. RZ0]|uniref:hypothetical protein n=1 Tax=Aquimarina sp. RZ0 TaxID=2607730 RepID=UPI0011F22DB3|nr:hypothetical protein [Aquimarina sp. RZ0]KAA1244438.1 hypothetical protein F0000_16460 [Aquimarina sp. RZ0]